MQIHLNPIGSNYSGFLPVLQSYMPFSLYERNTGQCRSFEYFQAWEALFRLGRLWLNLLSPYTEPRLFLDWATGLLQELVEAGVYIPVSREEDWKIPNPRWKSFHRMALLQW